MNKCLLFLGAAAAFSSILNAQQSGWPPSADHLTLPVWPGVAPGAAANLAPEVDTTKSKDWQVAGRRVVRLSNVSTPTITLYTPKGENTGAAVVVFPGGGYQVLAMDLEGTEVCDLLNAIGVNCVLLKYRVPHIETGHKSAAAFEDAQRAMGLVRQHAAEWHIDPNRIGVLGFSAGGHLAALLSTNFDKRTYDSIDASDKLSCRPDFAVLIYPAYLALEDKDFAPNPEVKPTEKTPPTFLVQTEDDPVHVENALVYYQELKNAKVPAELHIYAQGGHGYGMRRTALPVTKWPESLDTWLHSINMLSAKTQPAK
jgi:acetyl esterase/lipase